MELYKKFSAICCLLAVLNFGGTSAAITKFTQVVEAGATATVPLAALGTTAVPTTITLAENFGTGTITTISVVTAVGTGTWASSNPAVAIVAGTGAVSVAALDYETATSLTATLTFTETTVAYTVALTLMITDVNDVLPVFNPTSYAETVTDSSGAGTTITTVTASDGDGPTFNTVTYEIAAGNTGTVFEVTSAGVIMIMTSKSVDRATLKAYALEVVVKDAGVGAAQETGTTTVAIGVCSNAVAVVAASVGCIMLTVAMTMLA